MEILSSRVINLITRFDHVSIFAWSF